MPALFTVSTRATTRKRLHPGLVEKTFPADMCSKSGLARVTGGVGVWTSAPQWHTVVTGKSSGDVGFEGGEAGGKHPLNNLFLSGSFLGCCRGMQKAC